jgi:hypothetical protein
MLVFTSNDRGKPRSLIQDRPWFEAVVHGWVTIWCWRCQLELETESIYVAVPELKQWFSKAYLRIMTERNMEEWWYSSTQSWPRNYIKVNGNLYARAALSPGTVHLTLAE